MRLTVNVVISLCGLAALRANSQVFEWANAAGGTWKLNGNWNIAGYPNGAGTSAVVSLAGSYTISLVGGTVLDSLQVLNSQARISVAFNSSIDLQSGGDFVNNGKIKINETAQDAWTFIRFRQSTNLSGTGSITLNANGNYMPDGQMWIDPGKVLTQQSPHVIAGQGEITGGGEIINNSIIRADGVLYIHSKITGSPTSELSVPTVQATMYYPAEAIIMGGRLTGTNHWFSGGKVSGITLVGECGLGAMHVLSGGIVNNGTVHVNESGSTSSAVLTIDEAATVSGTGMIDLGAKLTALGSAQITGGASAVLTNAPPHLIRGGGTITATILNRSMIRANKSGTMLLITSAITQEDAGTIMAGSGDIGLGTGAVITGGVLQKYIGATTGRVRATGSAKVSGVTNTTDIGIDAGAFLRMLAGGIVNSSIITINSTAGASAAQLTAEENATVDGTGTILLNAGANLDTAQIRSSFAGVTLTLGQGQTVRGNGRFYGTILNRGLLSPGATDGAKGRFEPRGPLTLAPESRLRIDASGNDFGLMDMIASNAPITLGGSVSFVLSGWSPTAFCTSLDFLTASAVSGTFNSYTVNNAAPAGKVWRLQYKPAGVTLRLTCPADFDADCNVDDADFVSFASQYDTLICADPAMPQYCPADLNADGFVDDGDFVIFAKAYDGLVCM